MGAQGRFSTTNCCSAAQTRCDDGIKEPLEQYELAQLIFRGMLISPEGQQYALVQRPDGSVASVKVGDYLGLNDGRIVEITPTQINLIEILFAIYIQTQAIAHVF